MNRVLAVVEGQTEQTFVRDVLAPDLAPQGVFLTAMRVGKPGHKGGIQSWQKARRDINSALKSDRSRHCTTMFDYYALPEDWPGRQAARDQPFRMAVTIIEKAMIDDVGETMGASWNSAYFIPYIVLHEFEALLFSDTASLADVVQPASLKRTFDEAVKECGEPEAIDDDPETAPSKRIESAAPHYDKVVHGPIAAQRIGLKCMQEACPHFKSWLEQIEGLGS